MVATKRFSFDPVKRTYTVKEAAVLLRVTTDLIYSLIRRQEFPVPILRLGKRVVINKSALDEMLNTNGHEGPDGGLPW